MGTRPLAAVGEGAGWGRPLLRSYPCPQLVIPLIRSPPGPHEATAAAAARPGPAVAPGNPGRGESLSLQPPCLSVQAPGSTLAGGQGLCAVLPRWGMTADFWAASPARQLHQISDVCNYELALSSASPPSPCPPAPAPGTRAWHRCHGCTAPRPRTWLAAVPRGPEPLRSPEHCECQE